MDKVINTFYVGNNHGFGFGAWNTTKRDYQKILSQYNYPSINNNSIEQFFDKRTIKEKPPHTDYIPSSAKLPAITARYQPVDFTKTNAQPLKSLDINTFQHFDNYGFQNTQQKEVPKENFTPYLIKMQMLEEKAKRLEYKNKQDLENNLKLIQDKYIGNGRFKKFLDDHNEELMSNQFFLPGQGSMLPPINQNNILPIYPGQQNNPYMNSLGNSSNNNENIRATTENMETAATVPTNGSVPQGEENKKEMIKQLKKKNKKKDKKNKKKKKRRKEDSNENSPFLSSGSNIFASPGFKKRRDTAISNSTLQAGLNNNNNSNNGLSIRRKSVMSNLNVSPVLSQNQSNPKRRNGLASENQILQLREMLPEYPRSPVAIELQEQAGKVSELVSSLNEELSKMKNKISNRLDNMLNTGMGQYEIYKTIINTGGNRKLIDAYRKLIDKEETIIPEEDEEILREKEYQNQIYDLLEKKLEEYNAYRDEEDIKRKIEEERAEIERLKTEKDEAKKKELEQIERNKIKISLLPCITIEGEKKKKKKKKSTSKKRLRKSPRRSVTRSRSRNKRRLMNNKIKKQKEEEENEENEEDEKEEEEKDENEEEKKDEDENSPKKNARKEEEHLINLIPISDRQKTNTKQPSKEKIKEEKEEKEEEEEEEKKPPKKTKKKTKKPKKSKKSNKKKNEEDDV